MSVNCDIRYLVCYSSVINLSLSHIKVLVTCLVIYSLSLLIEAWISRLPRDNIEIFHVIITALFESYVLGIQVL